MEKRGKVLPERRNTYKDPETSCVKDTQDVMAAALAP